MAVAKAAYAFEDTLHNMSFEVTTKTVAAAIKAADALDIINLENKDLNKKVFLTYETFRHDRSLFSFVFCFLHQVYTNY